MVATRLSSWKVWLCTFKKDYSISKKQIITNIVNDNMYVSNFYWCLSFELNLFFYIPFFLSLWLCSLLSFSLFFSLSLSLSFFFLSLSFSLSVYKLETHRKKRVICLFRRMEQEIAYSKYVNNLLASMLPFNMECMCMYYMCISCDLVFAHQKTHIGKWIAQLRINRDLYFNYNSFPWLKCVIWKAKGFLINCKVYFRTLRAGCVHITKTCMLSSQ